MCDGGGAGREKNGIQRFGLISALSQPLSVRLEGQRVRPLP